MSQSSQCAATKWICDLERREFPTPAFALNQFFNRTDLLLSMVADALNAQLRQALSEGAAEIEIKWVNRLDRETNPDGMIGNFVLNAIRREQVRKTESKTES